MGNWTATVVVATTVAMPSLARTVSVCKPRGKVRVSVCDEPIDVAPSVHDHVDATPVAVALSVTVAVPSGPAVIV